MVDDDQTGYIKLLRLFLSFKDGDTAVTGGGDTPSRKPPSSPASPAP
jgi:hypothetical protein